MEPGLDLLCSMQPNWTVLNKKTMDYETAHRPLRTDPLGYAKRHHLGFESSFSTLTALVREKGYPAFLLKDRYDNLGVVTAGVTPVFVFHGTEDTLIPYHHSEALASAGDHVRLYSARCGHNDCPRPWQHLMEFLEQLPNATQSR